MIRVLIADDHPLFRSGLRASLAEADDVEVVGEAGDGLSAVAAALEHTPDVVLMDLQMPGMNGVDATRRIVGARADIGILVLTMFEDDGSVFAAMRAGARGYVLKGAGQADVLRAIRTVASGEAIFGAAVARRLLGYLSDPQQAPFPELTQRERQVLDLLAAGKSNQAIAADLFLSLKTVRNHVSNIFTKLQVPDRAQAIVRARDVGLGR